MNNSKRTVRGGQAPVEEVIQPDPPRTWRQIVDAIKESLSRETDINYAPFWLCRRLKKAFVALRVAAWFLDKFRRYETEPGSGEYRKAKASLMNYERELSWGYNESELAREIGISVKSLRVALKAITSGTDPLFCMGPAKRAYSTIYPNVTGLWKAVRNSEELRNDKQLRKRFDAAYQELGDRRREKKQGLLPGWSSSRLSTIAMGLRGCRIVPRHIEYIATHRPQRQSPKTGKPVVSQLPVLPAMMLSVVYFWCACRKKPEKWCFHSDKQWCHELGISRTAAKQCRKLLIEMDLIKTKRELWHDSMLYSLGKAAIV